MTTQHQNNRLRQIVADNATLYERIQGDYIPLETQPEVIEKRLQAWKEAVGKGDDKKLLRRLALENLSLETILPILGNIALPDDAPLPEWALMLDTLITHAENADLDYLEADKSYPVDYIKSEFPVPFEDFIIPFVEIGKGQLWDSLSSEIVALIDDTAIININRFLMNALAHVTAPTLMLEFKVHRVKAYPMWAFGQPRPEGAPSCTSYKSFIQEMLHDNLRSFFGTYPVLGKLLVESIHRWQTVVEELLTHFAEDLPAIQKTFNSDATRISELKFGLSDPHNGGHMAITVTLNDGMKLIYKPHSLGLELVYQKLVRFLNQRGLPLQLKTLSVLTYDNHGWVEFIRHGSCTTETEVERFYERLGMLMGLMYMLCGTDYHRENIIVAGEHPIPVDMEMLLYPQLSSELLEELDSLAINLNLPEVNVASVFQSGIVQFGRPREGDFDASFLGNIAPDKREVTVPRWLYINSDYMAVHAEKTEVQLSTQTSVLLLNDIPQSAYHFIPHIERGFQTMYTCILENRETLLAADSPLYEFQDLPARFVLRATRIYGKILKASLEPAHTRNAIDRSIYFEHLARAFAYESEIVDEPRFWVMFRDEVESLTLLDIPLIYMFTTSMDIKTSKGHIIPNCFVSSGYEQLFKVLNKLSKDDMARQQAYLHLILNAPIPFNRPYQHTEAHTLEKTHILSRDDMLTEALRLAEQVKTLALTNGQTANWIELTPMADREHRVAQFADDYLYNGQIGIALFLNAVWQHTQDTTYRELVNAIIYNLHRRIKYFVKNNPQDREFSLGLAGMSSVAYGLTQIMVSRDEDRDLLLETAQQVAGLMTPERIAADKSLDVIAGAAGVILMLIPFYQHTRNPQLLNTLNRCGEHLLMTRTESQFDGLRAWATLDDTLLTGFSHGAAGIAYALMQLYHLTGHAAYREAAQEGLAYEQKTYMPEVCNWPDLRDSQTHSNSWCHGAPGITLSRALLLETLADEAIREEMLNGLISTRKHIQNPHVALIDHLCCGNAGRAEILWTIGHRHNRPDLIEDAKTLISHVVHRAHQESGYRLFPKLPRDLTVCGLFQGISGIGYTLLRFATGEEEPHYPNVLMAESLEMIRNPMLSL